MGCLYRLTFPNGKAYIGITTTTLKRRVSLHRSHARTERRGALQRAIRKYGIDSFVAEALVIADDFEYLKDLEAKAIEAFGTFTPNGYNLTKGGEGTTGVKRTPEQLLRAAKARKGYQIKNRFGLGCRHTEEAKAKISAAGKLRVWSDETKARIGASKVGNKFSVGRPCSPETREKIAAAQRGRKFSEEHRAALRAKSNAGKPWSAARRAAHEACHG